MSLTHIIILASLVLASGVGVVAVPPSAPSPPALLPIPPAPPQDPAPPPPPTPTPPAPGPSVPPKPGEKRCALDKPHRAHNWTDKTGQVFHCDGGAPARPR